VIEEMAPAWVEQRTMSRIEIRCSFRVNAGAPVGAHETPGMDELEEHARRERELPHCVDVARA
jgi:hypothetical protein